MPSRETAMPSDAKTIRKMWALNDENVRLKKTMKDVLAMLNGAFNKATVDEISRSGWASAAITNSIQELDACLNGEGKAKQD